MTNGLMDLMQCLIICWWEVGIDHFSIFILSSTILKYKRLLQETKVLKYSKRGYVDFSGSDQIEPSRSGNEAHIKGAATCKISFF